MRCRTCQQPVVWAEHFETGGKMPFDVKAKDWGAEHGYVLAGGKAYSQDAWVQHLMEEAQMSEDQAKATAADDFQVRTSHFASCPQADSHRRRKNSRIMPGKESPR